MAKALTASWKKLKNTLSGTTDEQISPRFGQPARVWNGPFEGMTYMPRVHSSSRLLPKLVGSYESYLWPWLGEIKTKKYAAILNVGCAEGYYTVGMARAGWAPVVVGFDTDTPAVEAGKKLAELNNVVRQTQWHGLCTHQTLQEWAQHGKILIFCDIEGGEQELLHPVRVPELTRCDMIVEIHDHVAPGIGNTLIERFHTTHQIDILTQPNISHTQFKFPKGLSRAQKKFCLNEGRPIGMYWLRLTARG